MNFKTFGSVEKSDLPSLGGKGKTLAILSNAGFEVPYGGILTNLPSSQDWDQILKWWESIERRPLAIRSSALGEDSEEQSFAGQNLSFLNVSDEEDLKLKVQQCFESINSRASSTYQKHFLGDEKSIKMNVVIQAMVDPKFSGVYFSKAPVQPERGWLFEAVEGLGEALVSGKVTPYLFRSDEKPESLPDGWLPKYENEVVEVGAKIKDFLNYDVDMEWAIDQDGRFCVLQARPITALESHSVYKKMMDYELNRLKKNYNPKVVWDGKTFSEWGGFPSYFTFSIWKSVFSPHYAFGEALKKLNYLSFVDKAYSPKDSVLERVFGRAYINLDKVGALYYGDIPYRMVGRPKPKLKFDWSKISLLSFVRAPAAIWRMIKVGFSISTQRRKWIEAGRQELLSFRKDMQRSTSSDYYKDWDLEDIFIHLEEEFEVFTKKTLVFPLILVILSESTLQSLTAIVQSFYKDASKARNKIKEWLAYGLRTQTYDMTQDFKKACEDSKGQREFMRLYGHRGPGELDLINPRWSEFGTEAFNVKHQAVQKKKTMRLLKVEEEIQSLDTLKKSVILQEWRLLKDLLELREQWKMELLKPYAHLRFMLNEIGKRLGVGADIHWLRLSELKQLHDGSKTVEDLREKILDRKQRFHVFKKMSFPEIISLAEIEEVAAGKVPENFQALEGESLSQGMVLGTVQVVEDPSDVDVDSWPEDAVLVAETTDPGWTPLFVKSKAIVIEKGGVLSHCAILARELEIPAVSGVYQCQRRFKTGDRIWVDGYNGVVSYEH